MNVGSDSGSGLAEELHRLQPNEVGSLNCGWPGIRQMIVAGVVDLLNGVECVKMIEVVEVNEKDRHA